MTFAVDSALWFNNKAHFDGTKLRITNNREGDAIMYASVAQIREVQSFVGFVPRRVAAEDVPAVTEILGWGVKKDFF